MISKTFEGYLMLDWKKGKMRVTKKKTKNIGIFEIPVKVSIKVNMPEQEIKAEGEITMSEKQAHIIVEDAL